MASGPRKHGESFKAYRKRLNKEEAKASNRTRVLWDSSNKGTYVRAKHGELK